MKTKVCRNCGVPKPVTDFRPEKRVKSGLSATCKLCKKVVDAQTYARCQSRAIVLC